MKLSDDVRKAMQMAIALEEIEERLPGLDCGSCGSPCCRALAEDIVRGYAKESDCIFVMRERLKELLGRVAETKSPAEQEEDKGES